MPNLQRGEFYENQGESLKYIPILVIKEQSKDKKLCQEILSKSSISKL